MAPIAGSAWPLSTEAGVVSHSAHWPLPLAGQAGNWLIKWHEAIEVPVEPGHHTLQVRKGRYSSRVKDFDAAEDEFVAFRCNRRRHPLILAATLFAPSLAISLTRE